MELARLLSPAATDSDADSARDDGTPLPASPMKRVVVTRRRWRKPSLEMLRAQRRALESVAAHLPMVLQGCDSSSSSTDGEDEDAPLDGDARRMRDYLRRVLLLHGQSQHELTTRAQLLNMLSVHYTSSVGLRKLMGGVAQDAWFWMCERWRSLTLEYYKPFSAAHCFALVDETLRAIQNYTPPKWTNKVGDGESFFGWRDVRRLDDDTHCVHFVSRKTYSRSDIEDAVDHHWSTYQDANTFKHCILGDAVELHHNVLQRISPDIMILQTVETYPGLDMKVHMVRIFFRVKTRKGFLVVVRTLHSPELRRVMQCEGLVMGDNFFWGDWDVTARDADGVCNEYQLRLTGYMGADNPLYAQRWLTEVVVMLVRSESITLGTNVVCLQPSELPDA